jgi:hypothetical protein
LILKTQNYKSNIAGAQAYLRNMKGVYEAYGKSYKGDSDLVELEKRLEGTNRDINLYKKEKS